MHSALCYHEAGHAVMAVWLGAEVVCVTIEPDRDDGPRRDGDATIRWRQRGLSQRQLYERELMTVLAGPVAEMVHIDQPSSVDQRHEWSMDWQLAMQLAGLLVKPPSARQPLIHALTVKLLGLISGDAFWQAIAEVADLLDAHETIAGAEVAECVERWLGRW